MVLDDVVAHQDLDEKAHAGGDEIDDGDKGLLEFEVAESRDFEDVQNVFYERSKLFHQQQ